MTHQYNRAKGIKGEVEICRYIMGAMIQVETEFHPEFPKEAIALAAESSGIGRNLAQTRDGGCDVIVPGICAIEVKRREAVALNDWWEQAAKAAHTLKLMPVLIWRAGRQPWRVRTWAAVNTEWVMADIPLEDWLRGFKSIYRQRLRQRIAIRPE